LILPYWSLVFRLIELYAYPQGIPASKVGPYKKIKMQNFLLNRYLSQKPAFIGLLLLFAILTPKIAYSENALQLHGLFADHAVIQRGKEITIWGYGESQSNIEIEFADKRKKTIIGTNGKWTVKFPAMPAGGPYELIVKSENERITVQDILIGDVYLIAGQSNMLWRMREHSDDQAECRIADHPQIRQFTPPHQITSTLCDDIPGGQWLIAAKDAGVTGFSSVGYYFARSLNRELSIPIGLLRVAYGGTTAMAFTSQETLHANPIYDYVWDRWKPLKKLQDEYKEAMKAWELNVEKAKREGSSIPQKPASPPPSRLRPTWEPASCYGGLIYPMKDWPVCGALWYQGGVDATRSYAYEKNITDMFEDWRKAWHTNFPVLIIQLPNFAGDTGWEEIREAQRQAALKDEQIWISINIELGDPKEVHPAGKRFVGERVADLALNKLYNMGNKAISPEFKSYKVLGNQINCIFDTFGSSLMANDGKPIKHFTVAGEDREFHEAKAKILNNNTVTVWSDNVTKPVAVRFAWSNSPEEFNLFSTDGLPASPFRTDDWPFKSTPK
jgi:sialate O-acetylesterase